ncbi:helix-turn-helix domain-containing protein [Tepidamorphus sp. 3E244]|uniref:helix-turn-helix domain-containing protein n=1 Tax=Tepidamorphus sp. 3E244 TaxID=3385498 RepID=UPI0038FC5DDB
MSNRLRNLALKLRFRPARIKVTLTYLCDRADEKGVCWPRQRTIAADTGFSLPSVRRSLVELEKAGYISRKKRRRSSHFTIGTTYRINLAKLANEAAEREVESADQDDDVDDLGDQSNDSPRPKSSVTVSPDNHQESSTSAGWLGDDVFHEPEKPGKPFFLREGSAAKQAWDDHRLKREGRRYPPTNLNVGGLCARGWWFPRIDPPTA